MWDFLNLRWEPGSKPCTGLAAALGDPSVCWCVGPSVAITWLKRGSRPLDRPLCSAEQRQDGPGQRGRPGSWCAAAGCSAGLWFVLPGADVPPLAPGGQLWPRGEKLRALRVASAWLLPRGLLCAQRPRVSSPLWDCAWLHSTRNVT